LTVDSALRKRKVTRALGNILYALLFIVLPWVLYGLFLTFVVMPVTWTPWGILVLFLAVILFFVAVAVTIIGLIGIFG